MTVRIEIRDSAEQLAADFAEFARLDWARVWAGPGDGDPATWARSLSWRLDVIDRFESMRVDLASGGRLYVVVDQRSRLVKRLDGSYWSGRDDESATTTDLTDAAEQAWPDYLAAARSALGEPTAVTAWDDPAFPVPDLYPNRQESHRPLRLAIWSTQDFTARLDAALADGVRPAVGSIQLQIEPGPGGL